MKDQFCRHLLTGIFWPFSRHKLDLLSASSFLPKTAILLSLLLHLYCLLRGGDAQKMQNYDTCCGLHVSGGVLEALLGISPSDPQYLLWNVSPQVSASTFCYFCWKYLFTLCVFSPTCIKDLESVWFVSLSSRPTQIFNLPGDEHHQYQFLFPFYLPVN